MPIIDKPFFNTKDNAAPTPTPSDLYGCTGTEDIEALESKMVVAKINKKGQTKLITELRAAANPSAFSSYRLTHYDFSQRLEKITDSENIRVLRKIALSYDFIQSLTVSAERLVVGITVLQNSNFSDRLTSFANKPSAARLAQVSSMVTELQDIIRTMDTRIEEIQGVIPFAVSDATAEEKIIIGQFRALQEGSTAVFNVLRISLRLSHCAHYLATLSQEIAIFKKTSAESLKEENQFVHDLILKEHDFSRAVSPVNNDYINSYFLKEFDKYLKLYTEDSLGQLINYYFLSLVYHNGVNVDETNNKLKKYIQEYAKTQGRVPSVNIDSAIFSDLISYTEVRNPNYARIFERVVTSFIYLASDSIRVRGANFADLACIMLTHATLNLNNKVFVNRDTMADIIDRFFRANIVAADTRSITLLSADVEDLDIAKLPANIYLLALYCLTIDFRVGKRPGGELVSPLVNLSSGIHARFAVLHKVALKALQNIKNVEQLNAIKPHVANQMLLMQIGKHEQFTKWIYLVALRLWDRQRISSLLAEFLYPQDGAKPSAQLFTEATLSKVLARGRADGLVAERMRSELKEIREQLERAQSASSVLGLTAQHFTSHTILGASSSVPSAAETLVSDTYYALLTELAIPVVEGKSIEESILRQAVTSIINEAERIAATDITRQLTATKQSEENIALGCLDDLLKLDEGTRITLFTVLLRQASDCPTIQTLRMLASSSAADPSDVVKSIEAALERIKAAIATKQTRGLSKQYQQFLKNTHVLTTLRRLSQTFELTAQSTETEIESLIISKWLFDASIKVRLPDVNTALTGTSGITQAARVHIELPLAYVKAAQTYAGQKCAMIQEAYKSKLAHKEEVQETLDDRAVARQMTSLQLDIVNQYLAVLYQSREAYSVDDASSEVISISVTDDKQQQKAIAGLLRLLQKSISAETVPTTAATRRLLNEINESLGAEDAERRLYDSTLADLENTDLIRSATEDDRENRLRRYARILFDEKNPSRISKPGPEKDAESKKLGSQFKREYEEKWKKPAIEKVTAYKQPYIADHGVFVDSLNQLLREHPQKALVIKEVLQTLQAELQTQLLSVSADGAAVPESSSSSSVEVSARNDAAPVEHSDGTASSSPDSTIEVRTEIAVEQEKPAAIVPGSSSTDATPELLALLSDTSPADGAGVPEPLPHDDALASSLLDDAQASTGTPAAEVAAGTSSADSSEASSTDTLVEQAEIATEAASTAAAPLPLPRDGTPAPLPRDGAPAPLPRDNAPASSSSDNAQASTDSLAETIAEAITGTSSADSPEAPTVVNDPEASPTGAPAEPVGEVASEASPTDVPAASTAEHGSEVLSTDALAEPAEAVSGTSSANSPEASSTDVPAASTVVNDPDAPPTGAPAEPVGEVVSEAPSTTVLAASIQLLPASSSAPTLFRAVAEPSSALDRSQSVAEVASQASQNAGEMKGFLKKEPRPVHPFALSFQRAGSSVDLKPVAAADINDKSSPNVNAAAAERRKNRLAQTLGDGLNRVAGALRSDSDEEGSSSPEWSDNEDDTNGSPSTQGSVSLGTNGSAKFRSTVADPAKPPSAAPAEQPEEKSLFQKLFS